MAATKATDDAEIVLLATSSDEAVISLDDLAPDVHVSTIGPKLLGHSELAAETVASAQLVATDSPQQIEAQGERHFLHESEAWERIVHLGTISARPAGVRRTVFLSAGLAGTEVLIADALLQQQASGDPDPGG